MAEGTLKPNCCCSYLLIIYLFTSVDDSMGSCQLSTLCRTFEWWHFPNQSTNSKIIIAQNVIDRIQTEPSTEYRENGLICRQTSEWSTNDWED